MKITLSSDPIERENEIRALRWLNILSDNITFGNETDETLRRLWRRYMRFIEGAETRAHYNPAEKLPDTYILPFAQDFGAELEFLRNQRSKP